MHEKETIIDKIGKVIGIAGNAILMNLYFLVCCIPVVTIGQAWAGLLGAVRYQIRGDKWQDGFKFGFKKRFWRGTISWCIMLVVDLFFLRDLVEASLALPTHPNAMPSVIAAGVVFALVTMVTMSLQLLNVYVPTPIGEWVRNAVNMVFKVPLELLFAAALFWGPAIVMCLSWELMLYSFMIFVTVYFVLVCAGITLMMKNALIRYLLQARTNGTLLAEEGRGADAAAQEEE